MKFTLDWLKDHLDTSKSLNTITDTLTNIGLEIESVEDKSEIFKNFTVAKVLEAEKEGYVKARDWLNENKISY